MDSDATVWNSGKRQLKSRGPRKTPSAELGIFLGSASSNIRSFGPRSCPLLTGSSRLGEVATEGWEKLESTRPIPRTIRTSLDIRSVRAGVGDVPLELLPSLDRFSGRLVLQSTPNSETVVERTYERLGVCRDEAHDYGRIYEAAVDAGANEASLGISPQTSDIDGAGSTPIDTAHQ
jgi:hypothetical protein